MSAIDYRNAVTIRVRPDYRFIENFNWALVVLVALVLASFVASTF